MQSYPTVLVGSLLCSEILNLTKLFYAQAGRRRYDNSNPTALTTSEKTGTNFEIWSNGVSFGGG
jgi:hypothetical protein